MTITICGLTVLAQGSHGTGPAALPGGADELTDEVARCPATMPWIRITLAGWAAERRSVIKHPKRTAPGGSASRSGTATS